MSETVYLQDYQQVKSTELAERLKKLQAAIDTKSLIYTVGRENRAEDDAAGIKLFANDQVRGYIGTIFYEDRTFVINSRFDGTQAANGRQDEKRHTNSWFVSYLLNQLGLLPAGYTRSDATGGNDDASHFEELAAAIFLHLLSDAFSSGVYRQYRDYSNNDSRLKGTLDCARHIRLNQLPNGKAAYHYREHTVNNPVNRLIVATWQLLSHNHLALWMMRNCSEYRKPLDYLRSEIGWQTLDLRGLSRLLHEASRPVTHPMYSKYEQLRELCRMILARKRFMLFGEGCSAPIGLLFYMPRLWEQFLESTLPGEQKQAHPKMNFLLDSNGQCRRELDADLIYGNAVLDAKYRPIWSSVYKNEQQGKTSNWDSHVRNDVYQVLSYMYLTGKENGGVIFPVVPETDGDLAKAYAPKKYCLSRDRSDRNFWLIPFPLPKSADSQEDYNAQMDANRNTFAEIMKRNFSTEPNNSNQ